MAARVRVYTLEREQFLPSPPDETFAFFGDALNLEAITPPWLHFRVVTTAPLAMDAGTLIEYRLRLHGLPIRWLTRIEAWEPGRRFVDVQLRGPYRLWHHTHTFTPHDGGTLMRDRVRYALPLGLLGRVARTALVRRDLDRIFDFRREAVGARFGSGSAQAAGPRSTESAECDGSPSPGSRDTSRNWKSRGSTGSSTSSSASPDSGTRTAPSDTSSPSAPSSQSS
jgi:ligand-binding SRPBCC domain-containing protein